MGKTETCSEDHGSTIHFSDFKVAEQFIHSEAIRFV